jgi:bacteriocin-like protein
MDNPIPEAKKIEELTEEDLKSVTGGDKTAVNTQAQNITASKAKTASKEFGSLDKFIAS